MTWLCDCFWKMMHDGKLYYRQLLCEAALFISCGLNDVSVAAWDELAHLSVSSVETANKLSQSKQINK